MSAGSAIGILIAIIVGAIVVMIFMNKILDFLSARFKIGYNIFLILLAGFTFATLFFGKDARTFIYIVMTFVFFYCLFTQIGSEEYDTIDWDSFSDEWKENSHFRPAWFVKLGMVAAFTVAGSLCGLLFNIGWLSLILESGVPIYFIINEVRYRRY